MKKTKILNSLIITPLMLSAFVPTLTITSCNSDTLLKDLEESTINEFSKLCLIPHASDKFLYKVPGQSRVQTLSNYLKNRSEAITGKTVNQDNFGNIWFDVEANDDNLKDTPTIALQAHMDMVFVYDSTKYPSGKIPDPTTTPIDLVSETVNGKRLIHSREYKTNIGGDNGIGVATILAILGNNNVKHGKLRIIFTNCEENAMQGAVLMTEGITDAEGKVTEPTAKNIMKDVKYVVNMDGGIGSGLCVACSGAVGGYYTQTFTPITPTLSNKYEIEIKGFNGGHSGNARNHVGNALKAMNETLSTLSSSYKFEIASISTPGTTVYNVIPPSCKIQIATDIANQNNIISDAFAAVIKNHAAEETENWWKDGSKATISITPLTSIDKALSQEDSKKIITLQETLPYGPDEYLEKQGLKTSANIAPATLTLNSDNEFDYVLETYSRSDSEDQIAKYRADNKTAATNGGFTIIDSSFHPWVEETNTKLFDLTSKALNSVGINSITKEYAHGGVEPAMWSWAMKNTEKITDGNCVCIGVNVIDEHKPTEAVDVDSIQTCMKVLTYIFEHSKELI